MIYKIKIMKVSEISCKCNFVVGAPADSPGGKYSQNPLELTSTLVLKVASNLS